MAGFQLSNDQINELTFDVIQAIGPRLNIEVPPSLDGVSQDVIDGWKRSIRIPGTQY